jgi:hypothetical protein
MIQNYTVQYNIVMVAHPEKNARLESAFFYKTKKTSKKYFC